MIRRPPTFTRTDSSPTRRPSGLVRDLADLEAGERVEIQRGPASTRYGSDALAGVVAFRTLDPEALLLRGDGDRYLGLRLGGTTASMTAAWCRRAGPAAAPTADRKPVVWGKSVSVRVDPGGRRFIKKTRPESNGPRPIIST